MQSLYLAQPYTHKSEVIREWRFKMACMASAAFYRAGYDVRSPIAHCHPIAKYLNNNHNDTRFWVNITLNWLSDCEIMVVMMLPGFGESTGISEEYLTAVDLKKPVYLFNPLFLHSKDIRNGLTRTTPAQSFGDAIRRSAGFIPRIYDQEGVRPPACNDHSEDLEN